jgi:hypothetical protein
LFVRESIFLTILLCNQRNKANVCMEGVINHKRGF